MGRVACWAYRVWASAGANGAIGVRIKRVPAAYATKESLGPGITRIRGNLCNVHGRYGPCDAGAAKKPAKGKKGRKPAKAKLTPEQRATARAQAQTKNRSKVLAA